MFYTLCRSEAGEYHSGSILQTRKLRLGDRGDLSSWPHKPTAVPLDLRRLMSLPELRWLGTGFFKGSMHRKLLSSSARGKWTDSIRTENVQHISNNQKKKKKKERKEESSKGIKRFEHFSLE